MTAGVHSDNVIYICTDDYDYHYTMQKPKYKPEKMNKRENDLEKKKIKDDGWASPKVIIDPQK